MMIAIALLMSSFAFGEIPEPAKPCSQCNENQIKIIRAFEQADKITTDSLPKVFSGSCFFEGYGYNPDREQHAVAMLDNKDGKTYYGGKFGFFHEENPYTEWTVEKAKQELPKLYDSNHEVFAGDDINYADLNPGGEEAVRYWFRQSEDTIFMILQWGKSTVGVCELLEN